MNTTQDPWLLAFSQRYFEHTGHLPVIQPGSNPAQDVAIIEHIGRSREYWFLYAMTEYQADYWTVFLALFADRSDLRIEISTAMILTERMLGDQAFELSTPDAWVLCLESLA